MDRFDMSIFEEVDEGEVASNNVLERVEQRLRSLEREVGRLRVIREEEAFREDALRRARVVARGIVRRSTDSDRGASHH